MNAEKSAAITRLNDMLRWAYEGDKVKSVFTPFETLGSKIIERLSTTKGSILVLSDGGLLVALMLNNRATNITFVAHTNRQAEFARQVGVTKIVRVDYNDPLEQLKKAKDFMDSKFDIILGNPPYSIKPNGKRLNKNPIYQEFFNLCVSKLNPGGTICWIQPTTWRTDYFSRAPFKKMRKSMDSMWIRNIWLALTPWSNGKDAGQAAVVVDVFVASTTDKKQTVVIANGQEFKANNFNMDSLNTMVVGSDVASQLKAKLTAFENDFIIEKNTFPPTTPRAGKPAVAMKIKNSVYRFPIACANRLTNGGISAWAAEPQLAQNIQKVIVSLMRALNPTYDAGHIAIGSDAAGKPVRSEAEGKFVVALLNSDPIQYLIAVHGDTPYNRKSKNAGKRNRGARFLNKIDIDFDRWDPADIDFKKYFHYLSDADWAEIKSVLK